MMVFLQLILSTMMSKEGHALTYNYDMTDPWSHIIEVTAIRSAKEPAVTKLIDGAQAGIPEACSCPTNQESAR